MATETTVSTGISLVCPHCGVSELGINLCLADKSLYCTNCEESFEADEVREMVAKWTKVLAWVDLMPGDE